jgi:diguanylate cyclase (GGDEF)-like protein
VETTAPRHDLGATETADPARVASDRPAIRGEAETRDQALARSFWLVREVQAGASQASAAIVRLIEDAERQGWPEVVLGGLYAVCVLATVNGDEGLPQAIERMLRQAEADADPAMMAMALALRARIAARSRDSTQSATADADLARATVLLESSEGGAVQRASAHNSCAIVYGLRRLWELQDEQYLAAEALLPDCQDSPLPSTVLFNRAELQLDWACAMREIGDAEGVAEHCRAGAAVSAAAKQVAGMPDTWRDEMLVGDVLLAAVGGANVVEEARALLVAGLKGPDGSDGYLHLAIALSPGSPATMAKAAERAVASIDAGLGPTEYDLALRVAADLEASARDGRAAGLRCAVRQIELRWGNRLSTLAAMEALLQVERLRTEHERLSRHANLDDLTGLSNRRGLHRYLAGLQLHGGRQLSLLVVDIDAFKQVNDRHGHSTGDDTLVSLAAILTANIRPGDLAVRLGGDEFALVLADTDIVVAARRADDIVSAMIARPWHQMSASLAVTVSVGLASGHPEQIDEITARADAAMYRAKAAGGSRAICS